MIGVDEPLTLDLNETDRSLEPQAVNSELMAALVPISQCLDIALPRMPASQHDLVAMLTEHTPILPQFLIWTDPTAVSPDDVRLTVAKRSWVDEFVGRLENEHEAILDARTADNLKIFRYRSPMARRARSITAGIWTVSLIALGLAIVTYWQRDDLTEPPLKKDEYTIARDDRFSRSGVLDRLSQLAADDILDEPVAAISSNRDGLLSVELATPDPDTLRERIVRNEVLTRYREVGQTRDTDGDYRVTYESGQSAPKQSTNGSSVAILRASNAEQASGQVRTRLIAHAAKQELQIGLLELARDQDGMLRFDLELTGSQLQVLRAMNAVESGTLPMRLSAWRIERDGIDNTRLSGTLVVPWTLEQ